MNQLRLRERNRGFTKTTKDIRLYVDNSTVSRLNSLGVILCKRMTLFLEDTNEVFRIPKNPVGMSVCREGQRGGLQMWQNMNQKIQRKVITEQFFRLFYKLDFFQNKILGLTQNQRVWSEFILQGTVSRVTRNFFYFFFFSNSETKPQRKTIMIFLKTVTCKQ